MRDAALPAALVAAALGLALAFAPPRTVRSSVFLFAAVAFAAALAPLPPGTADLVIFVGLASILLDAAIVVRPRRIGHGAYLVLAANSGLWAGAAIAAAGAPVDLLKALPLVLIALPGVWFVGTGKAIALKVVASWLVAVSILAGALTLAPITPGYSPDHLD